MTAGIPILMYHDIALRPEPAFRKYAVTPDDLAAQMGWLRQEGYTAIDLDSLLDHRVQQRPLPPKPVIITFDDGFQGCREYAAPILKEYGFTAVFFLVAGLIGKTSRWLIGERGLDLHLMDWDAVRELDRAGFQCAAHSMTHPHLDRLPDAVCAGELRRSKDLLEERLGHVVRHFAYPFGSYDCRVKTLAREAGFATACSVRGGFSPPDDDLFALHRMHVWGQDTLARFRWRVRTSRTRGEWLESAVSRLTSRMPVSGE